MKRTYVTADEQEAQQDRPGFTPVCQYGRGVEVAKGELGSITKQVGEPYVDCGMWVIPCETLERIFIREDM